MESKIVINKEPSFKEVWREGHVEYEGNKYYFWLIDPEGEDDKGQEYEMEVRWFFKNVPKAVRAMYPYIIESFKTIKYDNRNEDTGSSSSNNSLPTA